MEPKQILTGACNTMSVFLYKCDDDDDNRHAEQTEECVLIMYQI